LNKEGDSAPVDTTFSHKLVKKERYFQDWVEQFFLDAKEEKQVRNLRLRPLKRRCHRQKVKPAKIPEGVENSKYGQPSDTMEEGTVAAG